MRWIRPAAGYVGAVVGAGFASGREVQHFFAAQGGWGLAGAALAGGLFALVGAIVLRAVARAGIRHHGALLRTLLGRVVGGAFDGVGTIVLAAGLVVVLAGGGALGGSVGHWPRLVGVMGLAGLLAATEILGSAVHATVNLAVVALIVVTAVLAMLAGAQPPPAASVSATLPWALAAVLYVAYNLVLGIAGLCVSADSGLTAGEAALGGLAGGAALGLLCAAIAWALRSGAGAEAELPLGAVLAPGYWRSYGYPATLLLALWTTGAATVRALGRRLAGGGWVGLLAIACAVPFAGLGLVRLVASVYPVLGFVGLPLVVAVAWVAARDVWSRARPLWPGGGPER